MFRNVIIGYFMWILLTYIQDTYKYNNRILTYLLRYIQVLQKGNYRILTWYIQRYIQVLTNIITAYLYSTFWGTFRVLLWVVKV